MTVTAGQTSGTGGAGHGASRGIQFQLRGKSLTTYTIPNLAQFSFATDRHQVNAFPVSSVTAILTISVGCVTPATSQNCWTLNVQLASFVASPSNFSGLSNLIFEPVKSLVPSLLVLVLVVLVVVPAVLPCTQHATA